MNQNEAVEKIKSELKLKEFSHLTAKNYIFFIEKFIKFSGKQISEINEEDVKKYLASLSENKSRATLSLAYASINFFFSHLGKPSPNISLPKKEKKIPIILDKEEVKKLIDSAETRKSKLIFSLLYSSGLKVSEIVNLRISDIDFSQNIGWVRKANNKDRIFTISNTLSKDLEQYSSENKNNKYLFSKEKPLTPRNIQKIIQSTSRKIGIKKKVSPHTLRHSFSVHLHDSGIDSKMINAILGYENIHSVKFAQEITEEQIKSIKNPFDNLMASAQQQA